MAVTRHGEGKTSAVLRRDLALRHVSPKEDKNHTRVKTCVVQPARLERAGLCRVTQYGEEKPARFCTAALLHHVFFHGKLKRNHSPTQGEKNPMQGGKRPHGGGKNIPRGCSLRGSSVPRARRSPRAWSRLGVEREENPAPFACAVAPLSVKTKNQKSTEGKRNPRGPKANWGNWAGRALAWGKAPFPLGFQGKAAIVPT